MQAIVVEHRGERGRIEDRPVPEPSAHEILVRVTAAGVNPIDWKTRDGNMRAFPFVLGQDFAGVVSATGSNVTGYGEGERIFGIARTHGAYAQFTLVPAAATDEPICHIPDDVGDADAAALPTAGLTALAALDVMKVSRGTTLTILGVTGGVGGFAAQIAHSRGARIIGSGHSKHEDVARSFGIDEYVAYDRENVVDAIRRFAPDGADAILDLVDDRDGIRATSAALRAGGAIVSTIGAADEAWFREHGFVATNLVMNQTPQSSHEGLRELVRMVEDGTIHVRIAAERDLRDAPEALDASKAGSISGKMILTVE